MTDDLLSMKLYTRSGDDGSTGLFGGRRVDKDHPRVEAYGTVDELNAVLGVAAAAVTGDRPFDRRLREMLATIQGRLFDLGADLATPQGSPHEEKVRRVGPELVTETEAWIDEVEAGNVPMTSFVLPGGCPLAGHLHVARAVCRRAERRLLALSREEAVGPVALPLLNRLGDLLFALARRANREAGVPDVPWTPGA